MRYKHLITDEEAASQYRLLIESIKAASYKEKAAMLRTQFDTILHICAERHLGRELGKNDSNSFKGLIDILFPEGRDPALADLRNRLHCLRLKFNRLSAHTFPLYKDQKAGKRVREYGQHDYEFSLDVLSELIAFVSSSPVPPQVNSAKKQYERVGICSENRLDIILMMELFTAIDEVEEGAKLLHGFNEMVSRANKQKLNNVHFQLITYCQPICSTTKSTLELLPSIPFNLALDESMSLVYDALDLNEACQCERPWFILLSRSIPNVADVGMVQEIKELYTERRIDFMPIALTEVVKDQYNTIWPHSRPVRVSPSISSNFYKELLASIQRQLQSNLKKS